MGVPAKGKKAQSVGKAARTKAAKTSRSAAGLAKAKAAVAMTTEEWREHQVGMKELWPAPDYMKVSVGRRSATCFWDETYSIVTRWTEETRISYRPHAKAPGSKSHVRYEAYSEAKTVGEALELGTYPIDWCWDYERGFIKVHGPVRDEPLDLSKVMDESVLSKVDVVINRWYRRELAKSLGLRYEDLAVGKGSGESTLMRANRLVAQREAEKRLDAAEREGRRITDRDVELTLRRWAFARNANRTNVMREGQSWVWSDTLGLLIDRIGDIHITAATKMYPAVTRIITRWLSDRLPPEIARFGYTSLNLNCNYAAKLHRDKNNFGPSLIKAFGTFTGGELNYWPEDNGATKLEDLPGKNSVQLQIRDGLAMFNGNCAHSVEDFEGERFSVVFFTLGCHAKAKPEDIAKLKDLGVIPPTPEADRLELLRAPRGYGLGASAALAEGGPGGGSSPPEVRFWSTQELESKHPKPGTHQAPPQAGAQAIAQQEARRQQEGAEAAVQEDAEPAALSPTGSASRAEAPKETPRRKITSLKRPASARAAKEEELMQTPEVLKWARKSAAAAGGNAATPTKRNAPVVIDQATLKKAERGGLLPALKNLAGRQEIRKRSISGSRLLKVLESMQAAGGLANAAKRALKETASQCM